MKRVLYPCSVVVFAYLCCNPIANENMLVINNRASGSIILHFQGEDYEVSGGNNSREVKDIPNGTFEYSTTYAIPSNVTSVKAGEGMGGSMVFQNSNTVISIDYASAVLEDEYQISASVTSSTPQEITAPNNPAVNK